MNPGRRLLLDGAHNIRDIGGYETREGAHTKWRRFLRADSPHRLSPAAQATLLEYGVRTLVDLRRTLEIHEESNAFEGSALVEYHHLNMAGDKIGPGSEAPGAELIANGYTNELESRRGLISQILQTLADAGDHVVLYHCVVGKDRTGLISALLLGLAGVPDETIAADYALSARYLVEPYRAMPGADPRIRAWGDYQRLHCPPEAMLSVLENLHRIYGGAEKYMRESGLSEDQTRRLHEKLLAP